MSLSEDQVKRDLNWIIQSPFILKENINTVSNQFFSDLFSELSQSQITHLAEQISTEYKPNRLGHYFEYLILNLLKSLSFINLIYENYQIISGKKTLGEIDVVFKDNRTQKYYHWELSIKFYINNGLGYKLNHFIGPNSNDRFDFKYNHVLEHQLKLSSFLNLKQELNSQFLLKGYLFYSIKDYSQITIKNYILNSDHSKGWVIKCDDVHELLNLPSNFFIMLNKKEWISPFSTHNDSRVMTYEEIKSFVHHYFKHYKHGILVANMIKNQNIWEESNRGFIIPNEWPHDNGFI